MIQQKTFSASFTGFLSKGNNEKIVKDVAQQVVDWINSQDGSVVIEHVAISQTGVSAHAVVLFRDTGRAT